MPVTEVIGRRQSIPVIYTKGTHYDVGYDVGRTVATLIQSFLESCHTLNEEYLPAYNTPKGKKAYEDTLNVVKLNYPQYVRELEGIADGAKVPFYKLFILHMDRIITCSAGKICCSKTVGCSTICVNQENQEILGHNEDATSQNLNNFYFVSAHIISDKPQGRWGVIEEKFISLCYPGHLPGYTMNYNHHGLIFSINTLTALHVYSGKTPRHFLTRALLSAENFSQVQQILRDPGCGAGDGCSINMTFLNEKGDRVFRNIEMAPATKEKESQLNIQIFRKGESLIHCNTYFRSTIDEECDDFKKNSEDRMCALKSYPKPLCKEDVIRMLGDQSGITHKVFQESGPKDILTTIAVGIFDCKERTFSIYADNPRKNDPLIVLPLFLKTKSACCSK